jgi:hypothetical protein
MSSVSNATTPAHFQIAVARLKLDNVEQEGRNALALIEASSPPQGSGGPPPNAAGVGQTLNIVA